MHSFQFTVRCIQRPAESRRRGLKQGTRNNDCIAMLTVNCLVGEPTKPRHVS
jgi:hypothetical protein